MTIRSNKHPIFDVIKPQHNLISTFWKNHLEKPIGTILDVNPDAMFYSTGGTGKVAREILRAIAERNSLPAEGFESAHYMSVEEFTGAPEMEGGLVKTLHPKIHAGLLGERGNPEHEKFLTEEMAKFGKGPGVYFDTFIGNLYPFADAVDPAKTPDTNPEVARINIDIGGPGMTMAVAKNWHSVAALTDPAQYDDYCQYLLYSRGSTLEMRFRLAQAAMKLIGEYRKTIGDHFASLDYANNVMPTLNIAKAEQEVI